MALAFEQQPRESNKAYEAFRAYLELGPKRRLVDAGTKIGKSRRMMASWSDQWKWSRRVAAYNAHLVQLERETAEALTKEKAVDWAKRHESVRQEAWKEAEELIELAQEFKAQWREAERPPQFGAVVRALELAFKLKQFAAGMPTEVKEVTGEVDVHLDVEWEVALRKVYGGDHGLLTTDHGPERQKAEVGGQRSEIGGQRSEIGGQRSEVGGGRAEVGGRRAEDGGREQKVIDAEIVTEGNEVNEGGGTLNVERRTSNVEQGEEGAR